MDREFLFEKKHWRALLEKLVPSIRLKVKNNIVFNESILFFAPHGEDDGVRRDLTLSLELKEGGYLGQKDIEMAQEAIGIALIDVLKDLGLFDKNDTLYGEKIYKDAECDGSSFERSTGQYGHVYLVRNGDLHKIGITENLLRRFDQLKPDEVVNTIRCSNFQDVERQMHAYFGSVRLPQTEYFRLTKEQVNEAIAMMLKIAIL